MQTGVVYIDMIPPRSSGRRRALTTVRHLVRCAVIVIGVLLWWAWWSSAQRHHGQTSQHGQLDWDDWGAMATELAGGTPSTWYSRFQNSWNGLVRGAGLEACIHAHRHLLYPFSGGDISTMLAVHPLAQGYVMLSNMPALAPDGWAFRDNRTRLAAASTQAAEIIRLSHAGGYQYGFLLRRFAAQHGVVMLLLAVLGSLSDVRVESVLPISELGRSGVELRCRRRDSAPYRRFWIRYLDVELKGAQDELEELEKLIGKWVGSRGVMILKGAESALQLQSEEEEAFRSLRPDTVQAARQVCVCVCVCVSECVLVCVLVCVCVCV